MKPVIFFDFDGTILDIRNRFYKVYYDCLTMFNGTPISREEYWQLKQSKRSEFEILQISEDENKFPQYEEKRLEIIETQPYLLLDEVWPGLENNLLRLQPQFDLSIVTLRHFPDLLKWQIDYLDIGKYFSNIISPSLMEFDSPRYELKVKMVREFFGEGDISGWFIGDTEVDINAGKALGLNTCAVALGLRNSEILKILQPDRIVETLDDLKNFLNSLDSD
jgi:phosphoglycolate phosphatase